jgi:hypothetical protein
LPWDFQYTLLILSTRGTFEGKANICYTVLKNRLVMHIILALTQVHDDTLAHWDAQTSPGYTLLSDKAMYHWGWATRILRQTLSRPITDHERDATYLAVTLQSIIYLAATQANEPGEAWPLRSRVLWGQDPAPQWLKLCDGKRTIAQLTNPTRRNGAFQLAALDLKSTMEHLAQIAATPIPSPRQGSINVPLPQGFYDMFDLESSSDAMAGNQSTYTEPVRALSWLLTQEPPADSDQDLLQLLSWTCVLDEDFRARLRAKDGRAMLLLVYWYARIGSCRRIWWMWRQCWTEGLAICSYLKSSWTMSSEDDRRVLVALLEWPKAVFTKARARVVDNHKSWLSPI